MKRITAKQVIDILYAVLTIATCVFMIVFCIVYHSNTSKRISDLERKIDILASNTDVRLGNLNLSVRRIEADIFDFKNDFTVYKDRIRKQLDDMRDDIFAEPIVEEVQEEQLQVSEPIDISEEVVEEPETLIGGAMAIKDEHSYIEEIDDDPQVIVKPNPNPVPTGPHLTPSGGVFNGPSGLETYYNMDMSVIVQVAHSNGIGGEYWIREDGCKMLGDYIICACNRDVHPYGTLVQTSLGTGISLDTGGFAANNPTQIDIATNW